MFCQESRRQRVLILGGIQDNAYLLPQTFDNLALDKSGRVVAGSTELLTFSGIGLYRPELFCNTPPGPSKLSPLLRQAIAKGRVSGQKADGFWMDIGTPERLQELDSYYWQQRNVHEIS